MNDGKFTKRLKDSDNTLVNQLGQVVSLINEAAGLITDKESGPADIIRETLLIETGRQAQRINAAVASETLTDKEKGDNIEAGLIVIHLALDLSLTSLAAILKHRTDLLAKQAGLDKPGKAPEKLDLTHTKDELLEMAETARREADNPQDRQQAHSIVEGFQSLDRINEIFMAFRKLEEAKKIASSIEIDQGRSSTL